MVKTSESFCAMGKAVCNYCGKEISYFAIMRHEAKCAKVKHGKN